MTQLIHTFPLFAASRRDAWSTHLRGRTALAALVLVPALAAVPGIAPAQDGGAAPAVQLQVREAPPPVASDAVKAQLQARMATHARAFAGQIGRIEEARDRLVACRADARRQQGEAEAARTRACHAEQAAANEEALALMAEEAGAILDTLADASDGHRTLAGRAGQEAQDLAERAAQRSAEADAIAREIRRLQAALAAGGSLDEHEAARLRESWTHLQRGLASLGRREAWARAGARHHLAVADGLKAAHDDVDLLKTRLANAAEVERWYLEEVLAAATYEETIDQGAAVLTAAGNVAQGVAGVLRALDILDRDTPQPPDGAPDLAGVIRVAPADRAELEAFVRGFPAEGAAPALATAGGLR